MNKTIIINMNGVIFHIEEDAYELLKTYMNDIKKHFASYQDNFEIISDIENRIAELFSELLLEENKQVIVMADVEKVSAKMGSAEEFTNDSEEEINADQPTNNRKLYRDVDDRVIGGVCAGIGHYFGLEARWIRLLFFVLFIFFGFGLLTYALLWIVMPKAKTRTEKMEMKGEKINLQAFQKNVEDELRDLTASLSKAHENSKPGLSRLATFIRDLVTILLKFIGKFGLLIFKIIGFIMVSSIAITLIVCFITLLIFMGYVGNSDNAMIFPINALAENLRPAVFISAFLIILIPLIAIILFAIKVFFNSNSIAKSVNFSLFMVWIIAVAVATFSLVKNATDFKDEASYSETITLKDNLKHVYYLKSGGERTVTENIIGGASEKTITITGHDRNFDNPNNVAIELHLIETGIPTLIKTYTARGKNFDAALINATQIEYYYLQKDSLITFDYQSELKKGSLWRNQEVKMKLNFPVGSIIYIEQKLAQHFFQNQMYDCLDYDSDNEQLIKVLATKEGFVCDKTTKAIERQKENNLQNDVKDTVSTTFIFN